MKAVLILTKAELLKIIDQELDRRGVKGKAVNVIARDGGIMTDVARLDITVEDVELPLKDGPYR